MIKASPNYTLNDAFHNGFLLFTIGLASWFKFPHVQRILVQGLHTAAIHKYGLTTDPLR